MSRSRDQQLADLLAFAEGSAEGEPPHADATDPLIQRLRQVVTASVQRRRELDRIDGYLERLTDAIMRYAMGDLGYTFLLDPDCDKTIDALGTGLAMMAEELKGRTEELAQARDAATAANHAKSAFLANMSHELRTPLNAIIGYAELVLEEAQEIGADDIVRDVSRILRSGRLLLSLISDVLDMAKIEAGRMTVVTETFSVGAMCQDLIDSLQPIAAERRNTLILSCPGGLTMHSDLVKVRQILTNLVSNALKFTTAGRISLSVSTAGDKVLFEVQDTGVGIPGDRLAAVFEPFVQADDSTQRRFGGTGLGLALVRRFCRLLGGDVEVESQVSVGSKFTASLARSLDAPAPYRETPLQPLREPVAPVAQTGLLHILVIDDDPGVHDLVRKHLRYQPVLVDCARTGKEGLEMARARPPVLVLLDVLLPDMAGWETLAMLKSDPALSDLPVVMMSVLEDRSRGIALGAADYLVKPIDRRRLQDLVGRFGIRGRVLVVDDDPDCRKVVQRTLEQGGLDWVEASNGLEALAVLDKVPVDLIMLDLMMPEMDGFELVRQLEAHPRHRTIPRVVLTALDLTPEQRQSLQSGVERVLGKAAHPREELLDQVATTLAQVFVEVGRA